MTVEHSRKLLTLKTASETLYLAKDFPYFWHHPFDDGELLFRPTSFQNCGAHGKMWIIARLGASFGFPPYFMPNWDSCFECIAETDERLYPKGTFVVSVHGLNDVSDEMQVKALDLFVDADRDWRERQEPYKAVVILNNFSRILDASHLSKYRFNPLSV
ncbi:barstar family protein [Mucisphaera sp.]|uniref:barstar family protein n=1 Tax=Mucisphaera sp. TaxID=2913024 RepID=UPI003D0B782D